ncbi:MAG: TetR/AcrR family transcriptional regulator [Pseudomonadota bacterium]|nr:TetR/AcrR family transcriptional regulator [Pseudomonadota bacterium]
MTTPIRLTDRKRLAILQAAASQFRAHGFDASSMDKIALQAGVSKRTVYNHFPSKEELFAATLLDLFESAAAETETPYLPAAPLREQLETLLRRKLRVQGTRDFIDLARVAIAEAVHAPERARPLIARIGAREEGLTLWIRAAQADGRLIAGDPLFASTLLQGQLKAVAFWPQVTMGAPPIDAAQQAQLVEVAVTMFLAYFAKTT